MDKIAIILPAFNEDQTIEATIADFHNTLPEASIFVIDNCSTDDTGVIARQTIKKLDIRGAVIDEPTPGKGNAVRRAFSEVEASVYVLADADATYPASRVRELVKPIIDNRADMVVGDRHLGGNYTLENKRFLHVPGNRLVRWLVNKFFHSDLNDIMSGYRAFSREFVKNYPILVQGFELETDMTLHALDKRFRILEIPVEYRSRPVNSFSKLHTFSDGAKVLFTIAQILRYYRPLYFFAGFSFIFALAGLLAGIPVLNDWVLYRYIYHVPLAILASGLEVISMVLLAIGFILDSIARLNKENFERTIMLNRSS